MTAVPAPATADAVRLITTPRGHSSPLIADKRALDAFIAEIDPTAPVAIDAERAQSFRYSSKAYLLQFHQDATGTRMLDPIALAGPDGVADLSDLSAALSDCEWVLHAASQDLPCLTEVGLVPTRIFDTELAGRLLGLERVSLSPMLAKYLRIELAKEHSADDWSRRPLPDTWLAYAALDVDYLLDLRDAVAADLVEAGKNDWARQEFASVMSRFAVSAADDAERWRNVKGLGRLRRPRELAVAKGLWLVRDDLASRLDIAPGRILPDAALVAAADTLSRTKPDEVKTTMSSLPGFTGRLAKRQQSRWASVVVDALRDDPHRWPPRRTTRSIPPPRSWERLNPAAAERWALARPAVVAAAEENCLPVENLLTVSTLADVMWPDEDMSQEALRARLADANARQWQIDLVAPALAQALADQARATDDAMPSASNPTPASTSSRVPAGK